MTPWSLRYLPIAGKGQTSLLVNYSTSFVQYLCSSAKFFINSISKQWQAAEGIHKDGYLITTTLTGYKDEVAGYRAQYGFDPYSLPGSVNSIDDIDLEYIGTLKKSDGTPVYPVINEMWEARKKGIIRAKKHKKREEKNGN
jgi:hypothetical protein